MGQTGADRTAPTISVVEAGALGAARRQEIIALCTDAFRENLERMFALLPGSRHVLAHQDGALVSHACWITRWLQPRGMPPLETAYVEAVATTPARQGQGLGSAVMRRLTREIDGYELGALSTGSQPFYERLGWESWRGPLAIRLGAGLLETPDDRVMVWRTGRTPPLNLDGAMTAEWREGELW